MGWRIGWGIARGVRCVIIWGIVDIVHIIWDAARVMNGNWTKCWITRDIRVSVRGKTARDILEVILGMNIGANRG